MVTVAPVKPPHSGAAARCFIPARNGLHLVASARIMIEGAEKAGEIELMVQDQREGPVATGGHLVVLVHGIRTRAAWYTRVRDALRTAGFPVELTNYGRFGIFRFLLPIPFFKSWAVADIERDIRAAMAHHKVERLSVIAHSFGTFVVARILRKRFDIKFAHIIFCGSVVKFRFPFEQFSGRFESLTNEVGTHDIWPILAESAAWGYGSTGAFGFSRPRVFDRYHRGLSHSAFLNADFCRRWWIPLLRGEEPKTKDEQEIPPLWLRVLSVVHLKYLVLVLLALWISFAWCRSPQRDVMIPAQDIYFAGDTLNRLAAQAERPCYGWCPELLQCQHCMRTTEMEGAVNALVVCRTKPVYFQYRDPASALDRLGSGLLACLQVTGVAERRLRVRVDGSRASEMRANDGRLFWLCGCDEDEKKKVLEIVNR